MLNPDARLKLWTLPQQRGRARVALGLTLRGLPGSQWTAVGYSDHYTAADEAAALRWYLQLPDVSLQPAGYPSTVADWRAHHGANADLVRGVVHLWQDNAPGVPGHYPHVAAWRMTDAFKGKKLTDRQVFEALYYFPEGVRKDVDKLDNPPSFWEKILTPAAFVLNPAIALGHTTLTNPTTRGALGLVSKDLERKAEKYTDVTERARAALKGTSAAKSAAKGIEQSMSDMQTKLMLAAIAPQLLTAADRAQLTAAGLQHAATAQEHKALGRDALAKLSDAQAIDALRSANPKLSLETAKKLAQRFIYVVLP